MLRSSKLILGLLLWVSFAHAQGIGNVGSGSGGSGTGIIGTFTKFDILGAGSTTAAQDSLTLGTTNGGISLSGGGTPAYNNCWWNDTNVCVTENIRTRERFFNGNAVLMVDNQAGASAGTYIPNSSAGANWIARDSQGLFMSDNGAIGLSGVSQTLNTPLGHSSIGLAGYVLNNAAGAATAWAQYLEGQHAPGTTTGSATYATEIDCKNGTTIAENGNPFALGGGCFGIWLAAGGGASYGPTLVTTNGATSTSSAVLSFASVPSFVTVGMKVTDVTTGDLTIGVVQSSTTTTVTMTTNAASAVGSGDTINFSFPPSVAIVINPNSQPWQEGEVFAANSLSLDANGNAKAIMMPVGYGIQWWLNSTTQAGIITSQAANQIQLGGLDQAAPNAQTIASQNTLTGTTNVKGGDLVINAGMGTGNQQSGNITLNLRNGGGSGSTQNSLTTLLGLNGGSQSVIVGGISARTFASSFTPSFEVTSSTSLGVGVGVGSYQNSATAPAQLVLALSKNNSVGAHTAVTTGDQLGSVFGEGSDGTAFQKSSAILLNVDAAVSSGIVPGRMIFQTANASGTLTEALRVTSAQLIQLTAITTDTTHTDATVCEDTTTHALYSGSGTLGICLGTSSLRYKHDVADLDVGLSQIMGLVPVSYKLNADHGDPNKVLYGFTAEQGGQVLPKLMTEDATGRPNTFDYLGIVPVLVKAMQQQQAEIEILKRKIR